jgi:predicted nucleotidyltransferase
MNQAINLHHFQDSFFSHVVERCVEECANHYTDRLVAVYVWGSVHRQEAVRGVSDLDLAVFVTETNEADTEWRNNHINGQLEKEFPDFAWGLIPPASTVNEAPHDTVLTDTPQEQMRNLCALHLLHNATLVFGRDVTAGLTLPPFDKSFARRALSFDPMMLARYAAGLESENKSDFALPSEPSLRLRKLARLAVLGGALLLMSQGRYKSDKGADVLPLLSTDNAQWARFLERTRILYITPTETTPTLVSEYSQELVSWLEWVQKSID